MEKREKRAIFYEPTNSLSHIKNVIGIVSGKGGVGKSLVTSLLASEMNKRGFTTAVLDADITGPSIPKAFGVNEPLKSYTEGTYPSLSKNGVKVASMNLILDDASAPVVWRGPVLSGAIKQFWKDIVWEEVDYMFVDLPPGTSDAILTVFQTIPLQGIVLVTSPQELVSMIVDKAQNMAKKMDIPVIGVIENYSYFVAPDTKNVYEIFGKSKIEQLAKEKGLDLLARIPINPEIAEKVDAGRVEDFDGSFLKEAIDKIVGFEG
ncbi:MAG: Mrp/NBP35 family ATP-binding protein [Tissierellia bacterium]|nr:Mrp/NBP35 family ATP-binding protein [Tissierellia bacterium]